MSDIRVIPTAALTATTIALAAFVTLHPRAAMWTAVIALVLAVCGLFALGVEAVGLRSDLDAAEKRGEDMEAELAARDDIIARLEADNMRMAAELADVHGRLADVVEVPRLRIVPPVADGDFPVHTAVDDAWLDEITDGRWTP